MARTSKSPKSKAAESTVPSARKTRGKSETSPDPLQPEQSVTGRKQKRMPGAPSPRKKTLPKANADRLPKPEQLKDVRPETEPVRRRPSAKAIAKAEKATKNPVPRKRKKANRPTRAEQTKILERRYLVWELYKAGASFRSISEHLNAKDFKASVGTVHADLKFCLALQHNELELDVKDHIANEVAVLDEIRFTFFPIMKDSRKYTLDERVAAGGQVFNTVKEKAKLLGLYKPPKMNVSIDDELAKILGIAPDLLPDVDKGDDQ